MNNIAPPALTASVIAVSIQKACAPLIGRASAHKLVMKRSRLALLLALALVPSACQFRACGLGCGSNGSSNIPGTPKVKPEPLKVPDPIPGEHGLAAVWFDNTEGLLAWAKSFSPDDFPKELTPEGLRELIGNRTGFPQLAQGVDFTRPFGCVGFNVMDLMQGDTLPVSCVFHFKGGLSSLETALSTANAKMEDDRLLVSIHDRNLAFKAWPATDAIWLTGGKKLAMQAKPVLEQKLEQRDERHQARVELSLYVAQIMDDYKVFARPMIKNALKEYSATLPLGSAAIEDTIDKTFNELDNLHELRISFRLTEEDLQLYFSQSLAEQSTQLTALGRSCKGPGIDPHLLGLLPDNSVFALAQNLNLSEAAKQVWSEESHEMLRLFVESESKKAFPHTHQEISSYIEVVAEHFEGNLAASMTMLGPDDGGLVLLYEPKKGDSPRAFWAKGLKAVAPHFPDQIEFNGQGKEITVQGVTFDRYQATVKASNDQEAPLIFFLDVGELDGVGIISASDASDIDTATQTVVDAIKGTKRFADTKSFKGLARKFAGNHFGFAADPFSVMNADPTRKNKLTPQGLGDVSLVLRGVPGKGVAMQFNLGQGSLKEISKEVNTRLEEKQ